MSESIMSLMTSIKSLSDNILKEQKMARVELKFEWNDQEDNPVWVEAVIWNAQNARIDPDKNPCPAADPELDYIEVFEYNDGKKGELIEFEDGDVPAWLEEVVWDNYYK